MWPFQAGRWHGSSSLAVDEENRVREATGSQHPLLSLRRQNLTTGVGNVSFRATFSVQMPCAHYRAKEVRSYTLKIGQQLPGMLCGEPTGDTVTESLEEYTV